MAENIRVPLGVAAIEDKVVQKAVAETILTPIYEAEFLGLKLRVPARAWDAQSARRARGRNEMAQNRMGGGL